MPDKTKLEFDALIRAIGHVGDPKEEARLETIEHALRRRLASVFEQPSKLKSLPPPE